jgi:hypothetical protein
VEGGTDGPVAETRTVSGLAFRISFDMPFGRGWQTARKSGGRSFRVAFVPTCPRTARRPVRLSYGAIYDRRCRLSLSLFKRAERRGCVPLAVSLDVINAFNSIPWDRIDRALEFHRVLAYLRCVVGAFLRDRSIVYTGRGGGIVGRAAWRGDSGEGGVPRCPAGVGVRPRQIRRWRVMPTTRWGCHGARRGVGLSAWRNWRWPAWSPQSKGWG